MFNVIHVHIALEHWNGWVNFVFSCTCRKTANKNEQSYSYRNCIGYCQCYSWQPKKDSTQNNKHKHVQNKAIYHFLFLIQLLFAGFFVVVLHWPSLFCSVCFFSCMSLRYGLSFLSITSFIFFTLNCSVLSQL